MTLKPTLALFLSLLSPWLAASELGQVSAEQLQAMQQNDRTLVIDVRTEPEWHATGIIPGSRKLQAFNEDGQFDASRWTADLQKLKSWPDQAVILVCRSGNRSGRLGNILIEQGIPNVYHLNHGIQSWIKSGRPVQDD